jgi:hypothetical protein
MEKKICFHIVSHGKLQCYDLQSYFFKKFKNLTKDDYDIIVWDNSQASEEELINHTSGFEVKPTIFHKMPNQGYFLGQLYALNETYSLYEKYKYVVHLSVDCFIVDDQPLYDWLQNLDSCECGLLTNQFYFLKNNSVTNKTTECYGTDFFVFKPDMLNKNFWTESLTLGYIPPELIMKILSVKYDIPVLIWTRMHTTIDGRVLCAPTEEQMKGYRYRYNADTSGIHHTHDLEDLDKYK